MGIDLQSIRRIKRRELAAKWRLRQSVPTDYRHRYAMTGGDWMLNHLYGAITDSESHWMGVRCLKNPLDAWIYQEILHQVRPEVVVELGSAFGGSTLFLCHMLDLLQLDARVISVDHSHADFAAVHPRIDTVTGDTRDPDVVSKVCHIAGNRRGLVIHDADHSAEVVLEDLRNYSPLVAPGSYLIVEDGVRDFLAGLPGPVTAIEQFLSESPQFEVDRARERYLFTYNPKGFLYRRPAGPA